MLLYIIDVCYKMGFFSFSPRNPNCHYNCNSTNLNTLKVDCLVFYGGGMGGYAEIDEERKLFLASNKVQALVDILMHHR